MGYGKCAFFAHDFSHLYTTGTKMEMRKNSIEFFHIPYYNDGSAHLWQNGMVEARSGIMNEG